MVKRQRGRHLLIVVLLWTQVCMVAPLLKAQTSSETDTCQKYLPSIIPKFKIVRETRKMTKSSLVLFVSVLPSDATRNRLIAVSCQLGKKYASEQNLFVWILDSERAAKKFNPQGEGNDTETNLAYLGLYGFSREPGKAHGQSLEWKPDPLNFKRLVHIDLGPPPKRPDS